MGSPAWFPTELDVSRRYRIIAYYLAAIFGLVVVYTVTYNVLLARLEGVDQSIFASFEFIVQTMTTTGYGQDADLWSHPAMHLFVSLAQISGIGIGFFTLRLIIIPLFTDAEVNLDGRLSPKSDHVVVCEYRRESTVLLDELRELDIEYVLVSSSRDDAKALSDQGYAAIDGSPQEASALERASIGDARAVITDAGGANVNTILTVRSLRPDVEVIALTDDSDAREVLQDAGANSVLSPHAMLGHRLAEKVVSSFDHDLLDTIDFGADVEVLEIPVQHGSTLLGSRIRETNIRERTGAQIIGAWIDGELQLPPDPDAVIRQNTVLLVSGERAALEELSDFTRPARLAQRHELVILAGFGEVGRAAKSVLDRADLDVVTVDVTDRDGVDVVGDASERSVLSAAGVEEADAVIVGLPDDSATLLTTVLARSMNPEVEVLARVSDVDATRKAFSGGADYVLSVPRVSARMVARELRGENVYGAASQIRLVGVPATPFAGSTLAESNIYGETGCRVIAIEDEDGATGQIDPDRGFTGDERLVIVGSDEAVQRFLNRYDVSPSERSN